MFVRFLFCQRSVRQRFFMKCFLMKNLLEVSTSGNKMSVSKGNCIGCFFLTALFFRSASCRGYRLPPCALINISHGPRADYTSNRLTAIVKPQPTTAISFHSQRQLDGLNHSPRSPFIPTQVRDKQEISLSYKWSKVFR